ncbi:MAG: quinolinate synthase NadA, partial [Bacillus sp. (in: Bacteria)]|nr:quinolinate synthase NadA [Bacillus sp. (in: firmicutes)]
MTLLETLQLTTLPEKYQSLSQEDMENRVWDIKKEMGAKLFLPCHHYQREEVYQFADAAGDSLQLAQISAKN